MEIRNLIKTKIPSIESHWHEVRKEHHMARLFSTVRLKMGLKTTTEIQNNRDGCHPSSEFKR